MLTVAALNKRMLYVFETVKVRFGKPKSCEAIVSPSQGQVTPITIPRGFDDDYTLRYIFHELAHVVLPGELSAFGEFEEDIIVRVLEPAWIRYVTSNGRRHARWLANVKRIPGYKGAA